MSAVFHGRNVNAFDYITNNNFTIICGIKNAGELLRDNRFKIDLFCDWNKDICCSYNNICGIELVYIDEIKDKLSTGRATIIVCTRMPFSEEKNKVYDHISKMDIEADVFDYFSTRCFFGIRNFVFKRKVLELFEHPYNCFYTDERMTERGVELALAIEWLKQTDKNAEIIEVGAVTPYYITDERIKEIVDPSDKHPRVSCKKSIFDVDLNGKNVLSISTIEHVGTGQYGVEEKRSAIDALNKILREADTCLITIPYGFNPKLDNWLISNFDFEKMTVLVRNLDNSWKELESLDSIDDYQYDIWANALVIIEKGKKLIL